MYRRQRLRTQDVAMLGGWLFADLLLALAIIFLANSNAGIKLAVAVSPTPTPTIAPTPTPLPKITTVDPNPAKLTIPINPDLLVNGDPTEQNTFKDQMHQKMPQSDTQRSAALVLIFGDGPDQGLDSQISKQVELILRSSTQDQSIFNSRTVYRDFIDLGGSLGNVDLEIYFYVTY